MESHTFLQADPHNPCQLLLLGPMQGDLSTATHDYGCMSSILSTVRKRSQVVDIGEKSVCEWLDGVEE